jgi:hypothetical protein
MAEKGESTLFEKAVREAGAGVIALEEACKFRDQSASLLLGFCCEWEHEAKDVIPLPESHKQGCC